MDTSPRHRLGDHDIRRHADPLMLVALERHRDLLAAADSHRVLAALPARVRRRFRRTDRR